MIELTAAHAEAAVRGGGILGGGGGGSIAEGRRIARDVFAAGAPKLAAIEEVGPEAMVVTVSVVGAPSAKRPVLTAEDHVRVVRELRARMEKPIAGIISSENGAVSTLNGWLASAALGIPVLDAPADGRAHPTGIMGAMGLERRSEYRTIQIASGGALLVILEGGVSSTSRLIRATAVEAGGLVAVSRHPVAAAYVKPNAACGALSLALDLGNFARGLAPSRVGPAMAERLGGEVIGSGMIGSFEGEMKGGFDRGRLTVEDITLTFWNEYMTAERGGVRLATFPDLITTLDPESGEAFTSAEAEVGRRADLLIVPRERIPLGAGVRGFEFSEWSGE